MVRTSVTHSAIASCATFLFLPHFDVICDLLLNRRTATWNLFVKYPASPVDSYRHQRKGKYVMYGDIYCNVYIIRHYRHNETENGRVSPDISCHVSDSSSFIMGSPLYDSKFVIFKHPSNCSRYERQSTDQKATSCRHVQRFSSVLQLDKVSVIWPAGG